MRIRESNIELLRIVLMIMIITHHVIVHGLGLMDIQKGYTNSDNTSLVFQLLINNFVVFGVNTFVFISGYFGIKFKIKTIISFLAQALFYSLAIYLVFVYIDPSLWKLKELMRVCLPVSTDQWWFLTLYLGLFIMAPVINKGIELTTRKELTILIIGLLYLNCVSGFMYDSMIATNGYSIVNFITIYVIARYLNKYYPTIKRAHLYLIISITITFAITLLLLHFGKLKRIWMIFSYNNPFVILSSIMIFYTFLNIKIKKQWINFISPLVFGVYLIHDQILIREQLKNLVNYIKISFSGIEVILLLISLILSIFLICCLIELPRKLLFEGVIDKLEKYSNSILSKTSGRNTSTTNGTL